MIARLAVAFSLTVAFSAEARSWEIRSIENRMGDGPFRIVSANLTIIDKPRSGVVLGSIAIDCDMVMITFSDIIGGPKNAAVVLRADKKKPARGLLNVLPNLRTAMADEAQTKRTLSYIRGARVLYGEVQSATIGMTSFEVNLVGLSQAMRSAGMKCALPSL